jgi:hypothetical protein
MTAPIDRARFDHIGIVSDEPHEGEVFVEASRAWVTSPRDNPYHVEWVRFEPDSPLQGLLRTEPHVAFRVDDIHAAMEGHKSLVDPIDVGDGFCTVSFIELDGAVIEFMQYADPNEEGWF